MAVAELPAVSAEPAVSALPARTRPRLQLTLLDLDHTLLDGDSDVL